MYRREKQGNQKSRKGHQNMPSFSSTLLDDIYRSIDGNGEKTVDSKPSKKQSSGYRGKATGAVEDEDTENFTRARLVEKWMEKEVSKKVKNPSLLADNDVLFFSSTSSSSDSSGQLSSSSEIEYFGSQTKHKVSGFPTRPKPVRTGPTTRKHEDCYLFDDYKNHQKNATEDELMKSKSRALRIYSNLKKMKQPISPGGRLTTFINSLFKNENGKKVKNDVVKSSNKPSSASSFSRSCMNKYSPKSRDGIQRTVRFQLDEQKPIADEDMDRFGRPPLPPNALPVLKQSVKEKNRKIEEAAQKVLQGYSRQNNDEFSIFRKIHCEEEDDAMSCSSSDLFELDHLSLFGNNRFCEELPVYQTTHFNNSRAMASGLVR